MSAQVHERVTETHIGQPIILRHVVVIIIIVVVVVVVVFSILLLIAIKRREHVAEAGPAVGLENPRVGVRREHHEPTRAAPPPLAPFNDSFSLSSKQIGERLFCKMRSWRRSRRRVRVRVRVKESIEGVERETKHCHC